MPTPNDSKRNDNVADAKSETQATVQSDNIQPDSHSQAEPDPNVEAPKLWALANIEPQTEPDSNVKAPKFVVAMEGGHGTEERRKR